jgi:hypothetical protein
MGRNADCSGSEIRLKSLLSPLILAFILWPCLVSAQGSLSWSNGIADVEKLLEDYLKRSDELLRASDPDYAKSNLTPLSYAGNQYPLWYYQEHQCAILGRLLEKADHIDHLEPTLPPLSASLDEVWAAAMSLDTWVHTAKRLALLPVGQRAQIWNLKCVGQFGIPRGAGDTRGSANVFMQADRDYLWIYGDIVEGFYEDLVAILNAHPQVTTVGLGSGGGSVRDAVLAGQEIRKRGLDTQLSGPCYSACPLVFIGGVRRIVMRPFPSLGFHQIRTADGALPFTDDLYGLVAVYAESMGVDALWLIAQMQVSAPHEINLQGDEAAERNALCARGIVTGYQGPGATLC